MLAWFLMGIYVGATIAYILSDMYHSHLENRHRKFMSKRKKAANRPIGFLANLDEGDDGDS